MIEELKVLDDYFSSVSVFRTLFICSTEKQEDIYNELTSKEHSILNVTGSENGTDNDCIEENIKNFENSNCRLMLINLVSWNLNKDMLQKYVLPYQNLLVLLDISEMQSALVKSWINISNKNGFINDLLNPIVLDLDEN